MSDISPIAYIQHYAERIFHLLKRNIKVVFAVVIIFGILFFLYDQSKPKKFTPTTTPSSTPSTPEPTHVETHETKAPKGPTCALTSMLPTECSLSQFFDQNELLLEANGWVNPPKLILAATKTEPPFVFANLGQGVVSGNVIDHGSFAPIETVIFKNILKDRCKEKKDGANPPLVVDVGGNMGYFTAYAGKMGCRVNAYEPVPGPLKYLRLNVLLNGLQNLANVYQYAVDNSSGVIRMAVNPDWGLSIVSKDGELEVKTVTSEEIITEDLILLKIDTEGHEFKVLQPMLNILKSYKIENLVVETKFKEESHVFMRHFINEMAKDYFIVSYAEEYFTPNHNKNIGEFNCVYVPGLGDSKWLPFEDLWYIRKESRTYDKVKSQFKCRNL